MLKQIQSCKEKVDEEIKSLVFADKQPFKTFKQSTSNEDKWLKKCRFLLVFELVTIEKSQRWNYLLL